MIAHVSPNTRNHFDFGRAPGRRLPAQDPRHFFKTTLTPNGKAIQFNKIKSSDTTGRERHPPTPPARRFPVWVNPNRQVHDRGFTTRFNPPLGTTKMPMRASMKVRDLSKVSERLLKLTKATPAQILIPVLSADQKIEVIPPKVIPKTTTPETGFKAGKRRGMGNRCLG